MGNIHLISSMFVVFLFAIINVVILSNAQPTPRTYDFYVYDVNLTRLCENTTTLTVNGLFPGPTIYVNKGETIYVNVHNNGTHGITIHWHGILQPGNPWSDGPLNITQCPIRPGTNFTQELIFSTEEGTLWYHAHSQWSMATVHGAIVVYPPNRQYPYDTPDGDQTIVLASWYKKEVMQMYEEAAENNYVFPNADGTTINGQPGYPNNCSTNGTSFLMSVEYGKMYLLRVVNAILNEDQFFGIAGHDVTLVGHDGTYTKPLASEYIRIAPGQTMDVLFTANQTSGCYYMASSPYHDNEAAGAFTNTTTSAILQYSTFNCSNITDPSTIPYPHLPSYDNEIAALGFTNAIRGLNSGHHPSIVPKNINKNVLINIGIQFNQSLSRVVASLNKISFVFPPVSILEAYWKNLPGIFERDFPSTAEDIPDQTIFATKALMFDYSDEVEIVFQNATETHPLHIHGFSFYVVASGHGDFEDVKDTIKPCGDEDDEIQPCYNLIDPPEINTVSVPKRGWVAVRFVANNPGVWFVHCHYEKHLTWGMSTVFIVRDGPNHDEKIIPPPEMPPCLEVPKLAQDQSFFLPYASI